MVTLPKERLVLEIGLGDTGGIFPVLPIRPPLSKVDAIPQLLGSERTMRKYEVIATLGEGGRVVVRVLEDHDIVFPPFSKKKIIGSLKSREHGGEIRLEPSP